MPRRGARRTVRAAAVVQRAEVEQHRALRHLGRHGLVVGRAELVGPVVAARDHACRAVLLGEVAHRPHRVALDLEARREREEVERPLVAVHELRGLARTDLDHLREVQLVARGVVAEHPVERAEHERMGGEIAEARRPGEQAAGAARVAAGELVGAGRGRARGTARARLRSGRAARPARAARPPRSRARAARPRPRRPTRRRRGGERRSSASLVRVILPHRSARARRGLHVGLAGRLVRIGVGAARESVGDPVHHVARRRRRSRPRGSGPG